MCKAASDLRAQCLRSASFLTRLGFSRIKRLKSHFFMLCSLVAVALLPSTASAQSACHLFTSSIAVPAGFGAPYNIFSAEKENLLTVDCDADSNSTFTVGNDQNSLYIYKTAYEWTGSSWQELPLGGEERVGDWYVGSASAELTRSGAQSAQDNFVVAYTCFRKGSQWKCGCRDATCATAYWQLQGFTALASDPGGASVPAEITACSNPKTVNVTPANLKSAVEGNKDVCAVLILSSGNYGGIQFGAVKHMTLRCAKKHTCVFHTIVVDERGNGTGTMVIDGMKFVGVAKQFGGSNDYGVAIYDTDALLVQNSLFNGRYNHDISTKSRVKYANILNNQFVRCARHCIEIAQNGNIRTRPSVGDTMVVQGNTFDSPLINAITQRYQRKLIINGNTFKNVSGHTVINWPYWAKYPFGAPGDDGMLYVPGPPLRTEIINNTFTGSNRLTFEGRGVFDDSVLIRGNSGTASCKRFHMDKETAAAHIDEQTTAPPRIDPASDVSWCNAPVS